MKASLLGIHTVHKTLTDGSRASYHYAWRGGPRMLSRPGTKAFTQEFVRLTIGREKESRPGTVGSLIDGYMASADFHALAFATRSDYERRFELMRIKFGTMPVAALEARGVRKLFIDWRDTMKATPRSADMQIGLAARLFAWAKDGEIILRNPLERVSKLHAGSRRNNVWTAEQLDTLLGKGAPHLVDVALVALWTMQRQNDVLTLPVLAYNDGRLTIRQQKTGERVAINAADAIRPILDRASAAGRQRVLVNSFGQNWTSSGFRASWRRELARLGISGVTFHDLRGTAITYAYANGATIEQIAEISGHSAADAEKIIRRHYLAGAAVIKAIQQSRPGR
ncbi:phage integrase family protein [Hoeflea marina]|uniref:Phage integrase family protein n=1 Tax=Hoeflea marina TaxID=274592 RepID=A0A317PVY0_9HYPH|nr:phage integrase family protein [Hoeflea marina]